MLALFFFYDQSISIYYNLIVYKKRLTGPAAARAAGAQPRQPLYFIMSGKKKKKKKRKRNKNSAGTLILSQFILLYSRIRKELATAPVDGGSNRLLAVACVTVSAL